MPTAARLGEDEAALVDEVAEVSLASFAESSGASWPLKKAIWSLEQILDPRVVGVHNLPGQQVIPVPGDDPDEVADVVGVVVPVGSVEPVAELVDDHGCPPLGEEQEGETSRDRRVTLVLLASPEPFEPVLVVDQLLGPFAIPVVVAEETNPAQPAHTFEAIEIVIFPLLVGAEVLTDVEVGRDPADAGFEVGVGRTPAAVLDVVVADEPFGALEIA